MGSHQARRGLLTPPAADPLVTFGDLALRLLQREDIPLLVRWRSHPEIHEWYGGSPRTAEHFERKYFASTEPVTRCLILLEGRPVGYLQFYEYIQEWKPFVGLEPTEEAWGIDLYLGEPELLGRGIGSRLLRCVAAWLTTEHGASRVLIDPHVDNIRAVRAYERAGFRKIRILPSYERLRGRWHDAWLMEWKSD